MPANVGEMFYSPEKLIKPASICPETQSLITYLEKRYWNTNKSYR